MMGICSTNLKTKSSRPLFSVEFFPPKSEDAAKNLFITAGQIKQYSPDFASITYGAGGSTRTRTLQYASRLHKDYGYTMMPHLTCVGHSEAELRSIVQEFKSADLHQIMALRGDPPTGIEAFLSHPDGLYYASDLVKLIREEHPNCTIGVAGYPEVHPEAPSAEIDIINLKRKVDAGADLITTQLFFDNCAYFNFKQNCKKHGINVPILPGLLSVSSLEQAQRFCTMCGSILPAKLKKQLEDANSDRVACEKIGSDWVFTQAKDLLENGAPGIHLYILNQSKPAIDLMDRLQSIGFYI